MIEKRLLLYVQLQVANCSAESSGVRRRLHEEFDDASRLTYDFACLCLLARTWQVTALKLPGMHVALTFEEADLRDDIRAPTDAELAELEAGEPGGFSATSFLGLASRTVQADAEEQAAKMATPATPVQTSGTTSGAFKALPCSSKPVTP